MTLSRRALVASFWQKRPPNIVLLLADDFGFENLSGNGNQRWRTPHLDALAARGVRFTHAHATPLCTPTRIQLMTGQYNFRNYTEFGQLRKGERTFAHFLKDAGYVTGIAGKWQLSGAIPGTQYKGEGQLPGEAGFDEHCLWQVKRRGSRYWDPLLDVNGEQLPVAKGEFGPDRFAAFAADFFTRHRDRPFFFYYSMALTHDPFVPTPASRGATEKDKNGDDPRWFPDMVAYLDGLVGKLVAKLDELGLGENTLVVFTGDNGSPREVGGGKGGPLANGTHVPLIARWGSRTPAGRVCPDLVDTTDYFPTFAEAAGRAMPAGHPRDGRSFLPQVLGRKGKPRTEIFFHYAPRWGKFAHERWVMDHRWKLYGDGRAFEVSRDPEERTAVELPAKVKARFTAVLDRMK